MHLKISLQKSLFCAEAEYTNVEHCVFETVNGHRGARQRQ
jgi:hypothetical protein